MITKIGILLELEKLHRHLLGLAINLKALEKQIFAMEDELVQLKEKINN